MFYLNAAVCQIISLTIIETRTTFWHFNSAAFESYWHCIFFLKKIQKKELQWCILSQTMSNSNTLDFKGYFFNQKNMYEQVYDIRNFEGVLTWTLEDGSVPCLIPTPVQNSYFVSWCLDVRFVSDSWFSKKIDFFRNQYYAQYYRVVVFHLVLISIATIEAAGAQYSISLANWAWFLVKKQSYKLNC